MPIEKLRPSFTFDQGRIEQLKAIAPEAFADGKINWEVLHTALGDYLEPEEPQAEHFGLSWPGKRDARRLASIPSKGTLVPCSGEGMDEDKTHNIFIEGDNLEVLKLLQKSYAGRVTIIYLDPPYNTGSDFIFKDDFVDPLEDYLKKTGQIGPEGQLLTTNPKTQGRFHTNWLNMMYPRLKLLQSLLSLDGLICVSIDDNEVHHLGLIMDEIFGTSMRLACAPWLAEPSGGKEKTGLRSGHEYLLIYGNTARVTQEEHVIGELNLRDAWGPYRKGRELRKWGGISLRTDRPNQWFPLKAPDGTVVYPYRNDGKEGHWRWGKEQKMKEIVENPQKAHWEKCPYDEGVVVNGQAERWVPFEKIRETTRPVGWSTWLDSQGYNADGTRELKELFGAKVLDTPKPTKLIQWLISLHDDDKALVLDPFAGSATTADAVLQFNQQDGGQRTSICVQLPERTHREDFSTVAEIGKERIRRVSKKLKKEKAKGDLGFKVFKLDRSNFKAWEDYHGEDLKQLQLLFDGAETPLVKGWTVESLLTEAMLLQGFPLDSTVTKQDGFEKNRVQLVESPTSAHRLFVCLDPKVYDETVAGLKPEPEDVFLCLDSALTDQTKMRLSNLCTLATI